MSHKKITATSILLTSKENCKQMTSQAMVTTSFCPTSIWPQGKGTSACTTSKCNTSKYPVTLCICVAFKVPKGCNGEDKGERKGRIEAL